MQQQINVKHIDVGVATVADDVLVSAFSCSCCRRCWHCRCCCSARVAEVVGDAGVAGVMVGRCYC